MEIFTEIDLFGKSLTKYYGNNSIINQINANDLLCIYYSNDLNNILFGIVNKHKEFLNDVFNFQSFLFPVTDYHFYNCRADKVLKINYRFIVDSYDSWFIKDTEVFPIFGSINDEQTIGNFIGYTIKNYATKNNNLFLPSIDIQICKFSEFKISERK